MGDPIKELKGLPPDQRIKRLKELEERNKKEIAEAERLIRQSQAEIEEEVKERQRIPIPQVTAEDVEALVSGEEREIFSAKRFVSTRKKQDLEPEENKEQPLEERAFDAPKLTQEQLDSQRQYFEAMPTKALYQTVTGIYHEVKAQNRDLTDAERAATYEINRVMRERQELVDTGEYKGAGQEIQEMLNIGKSIIKTLYRR